MFDLEAHLRRQIAFSRATFGPGERRQGVCDHIRKELIEVQVSERPYDAATEWVDVVILGLDGLTRALRAEGFDTDAAAKRAVELIQKKQTRNEDRDWPDWRTADPNKAIEHDRSKDGPDV